MVICKYRGMKEPEDLGRVYLPSLSLSQIMEIMAGKPWKRRME
jgi:hypothetical protein